MEHIYIKEKYLHITEYINSNSKTAIFSLMLAAYIDKYCIQENIKKQRYRIKE